jgi:hypothetical protein
MDCLSAAVKDFGVFYVGCVPRHWLRIKFASFESVDDLIRVVNSRLIITNGNSFDRM